MDKWWVGKDLEAVVAYSNYLGICVMGQKMIRKGQSRDIGRFGWDSKWGPLVYEHRASSLLLLVQEERLLAHALDDVDDGDYGVWIEGTWPTGLMHP
jgi:hypothetical protein